MSKRRNLKKEKAQRNQAYARQFRKKTAQNSGNWGRRRQQRSSRPDESSNAQDTEDNAGGNNNHFSSGNQFKP